MWKNAKANQSRKSVGYWPNLMVRMRRLMWKSAILRFPYQCGLSPRLMKANQRSVGIADALGLLGELLVILGDPQQRRACFLVSHGAGLVARPFARSRQ
jgi:hypothetical protein